MYIKIAGKDDKGNDSVAKSAPHASCFGAINYLGLDQTRVCLDPMGEFSGGDWEFEITEDQIQNAIRAAETIPWFLKGATVGPNLTVDFSAWFEDHDVPADKFIFCLRFLRDLVDTEEGIIALIKDDPAKLLVGVIVRLHLRNCWEPATRSNLNLILSYNWDDPLAHLPSTSTKRFEKLISLEEPHWRQDPFYDGRVVKGYKKSHFFYEGTEHEGTCFCVEPGFKDTPVMDIPFCFSIPLEHPFRLVSKQEVLNFLLGSKVTDNVKEVEEECMS